jgi:hypothetical protein
VATICERLTLPEGIKRSGWLTASTSRSHHSLMTWEKPVNSGPAINVPIAIRPNDTVARSGSSKKLK